MQAISASSAGTYWRGDRAAMCATADRVYGSSNLPLSTFFGGLYTLVRINHKNLIL